MIQDLLIYNKETMELISIVHNILEEPEVILKNGYESCIVNSAEKYLESIDGVIYVRTEEDIKKVVYLDDYR